MNEKDSKNKTGDTIRGAVGKNATNVVIGKDIRKSFVSGHSQPELTKEDAITKEANHDRKP